MAAQRQYATASAFRNALEARLNERARRDRVDLQRLRRQVACDRLLARMFDRSQPVRDGWVLKGGYALEMRFHMARSTKDLDLTVRSAQGRAGDSMTLRERLQLAASVELPDFFTFIVGEAMAELNQAPEGGARFPVDAQMDGRTFVKFHVDLGVGDEVVKFVTRIRNPMKLKVLPSTLWNREWHGWSNSDRCARPWAVPTAAFLFPSRFP